MNDWDDQLRTLKSRMRARRLCVCPDKDVPSLFCGHPLPCPYHTIIIESDELDEFIDELYEEIRGAPLTNGGAPRCPFPTGEKDE